MPYTYEYMNKISQFGIVNYTLKLTDSDGILPDIFTPVILSETEDNYDNLNVIANDIISNNTPEKREFVIEVDRTNQITTEGAQVVSETVINNI